MNFRELKNSETFIFVTPKGQHVEFRIDRTAFLLGQEAVPFIVRYELFSSGYNGTERAWDYLGVGTDLDQMLFWRVPEALKLYDATGHGDGGRKQAPPAPEHYEAAAVALDIDLDRANQANFEILRNARRKEAEGFLEDYGNGEIDYEKLVEFLTYWAQADVLIQVKDRRRLLYQETVAAFGSAPYHLPHQIRKINLTFRGEDALWIVKISAKRRGKSVTSKEFPATDPLEAWANARAWATDIE